MQEALIRKDEERRRLLAAYVQEAITLEEFQAEAAEIDQAKKTLEQRLSALEPVEGPEPQELLDEAVLGALRARVGGPLAEAERRELLQLLLTQITVQSEPPESETKAMLIVEHRITATPLVFSI